MDGFWAIGDPVNDDVVTLKKATEWIRGPFPNLKHLVLRRYKGLDHTQALNFLVGADETFGATRVQVVEDDSQESVWEDESQESDLEEESQGSDAW